MWDLSLKLSKANRIFPYLSSLPIFAAVYKKLKPMQAQVQQALEKLKELSLTKTTRNEQVQYFHFGNTHYTTPQGLILDVGTLVLAVNCPWQLQHTDENMIKDSEVFMRKRETGLPSIGFDWKEPGANLRDQRLKAFVNKGVNLNVEQVDILENNGFTIHFTNSSQLTITPDTAKEQEMYWQLFSNTGDNFSITAGASGII